MAGFATLTTLPAPLQQAVAALDYTEMTEIQAAALPLLLAGRDVVAQAKTGSGKTAAFGLALLAALQPDTATVQSLVLCPTRELADQVSKEIRALARFIPNIKVLTLCGGIPLRPQLASLTHQPHVVVGTPGRIQELLDLDALKFDALRTVVLDEADRMLDMGFLDAVRAILQRTPTARQTLFFSATYPDAITRLSGEFQRTPVSVAVATAHEEGVIHQQFYRVPAEQKANAVLVLLGQQQPESCLVFCNTKLAVKELSDFLWKRGIPALALQGDMEQRERDETLVQFANGSCRVLVATDVAARGLDIKALPLVIAYELSGDADVHTHRSGRTGRAGANGLVLNLVAEEEQQRLQRIAAVLGKPAEWSSLPAGGAAKLPAPQWRTLQIDAGRQDKLRPGDIMGALAGAAGLGKDEAGKIDLFATRAYVAVKRELADVVVEKLRTGKIKGRSFRVRKL